MRKNLALTIAIGVISLAACGSKTDANEKNFSKALAEYFNKKGELCLKTDSWPVNISQTDLRLKSSIVRQMAALESVGLVKSEDIEIEGTNFLGKPSGTKIKVKQYAMTGAAQPFIREKEVDSYSLNGTTKVKKTDLCWGKKALDKIVKWEGPIKLGDYQEASITYQYKINDLADWAKRPEIQTAFYAVKKIIDDAGNANLKHAVKLTSEGWEANGLE